MDGVTGFFPYVSFPYCISKMLIIPSTFDTPAFFGMDISEFRDFATTWYGDADVLSNTERVC
jgi:hypothetical protein